MKSCVIFGGSGFVGTHLAKHFLQTGRFSQVHIADLRPSELEGRPGITCSRTDVRQPIPIGLISAQPDWIFNLAAIHREPGHQPFEYYETNVAGAQNICEYADTVGCDKMFFTSSISVYGPTTGPTVESAPKRPTTPYGGSKYPAEAIHLMWRSKQSHRRLLICRPGVLYGPGDPGNIMRMLKAVKKGYFAFPGSPDIYKSYGYIFGLSDSIDFLMDREDRVVTYNYVETPTEPLGGIVEIAKQFLNCKALSFPIPLSLLLPVAHLVQSMLGLKNPIHPVRVRKAATPTHIVPQTLIDLGFEHRFDFGKSLWHWLEVAPADFEFAGLKPTAVPAPIDQAEPLPVSDRLSEKPDLQQAGM